MLSLTKEDLSAFINIITTVSEYKEQTLSPRAWDVYYNQYLLGTVDQIRNNSFNLNHPTKNTFMWMVDQIQHSKLPVKGKKPSQYQPLETTDIGIEAIEFCRAAAKGQKYYDNFRRPQPATLMGMFE